MLDPTVAGARAVDRAVSSAHGSTVDRAHNPKGYAILTVHAKSKGSGRVRARCGGGVAGDRGGAAVPRRKFAGAPYLAAQGAISRARGLYT
jgi:hypothetical protein